MKTHDVAKILSQLSRILRTGPNVDIEDLDFRQVYNTKQQTREPKQGELSASLSMLAHLSSVDKRQWISLIKENNFDIEIRQRDASRDIIGKLLKYLEKNEGARKQLTENAQKKSHEASPELMKALSILLKD